MPPDLRQAEQGAGAERKKQTLFGFSKNVFGGIHNERIGMIHAIPHQVV